MKRASVGICVLAMFWAHAAFASLPVSPANDDFDEATQIASLPFTDTVDNTLATVEVGESLLGCADLETNTFWYSFSAPIDVPIRISTQWNNLNSAYALYAGTSLADLTQIGCGRGGMVADLVGSQTYFLQVGSYAFPKGFPGAITFSIEATGNVSGRFLDSSGDAPKSCWIQLSQGGSGMAFQGLTDFDGHYRFEYVPVGDYKLDYQCSWRDGAFETGFYSGKEDYESADVIHVVAGTETSGIDVTHTVQPPSPPPVKIPTDLAVTDLSITPVPIQTDYANVGYTGWLRDVTVDVANLSTTYTNASIKVIACPETSGDCQQIASEYLNFGGGASTSRTYRWNGFGAIGDMRVAAIITPSPCYEDTSWSNNYREVNHYVVVGGTGFGAKAPQIFSSYGDSEVIVACFVISPSPSPSPSP